MHIAGGPFWMLAMNDITRTSNELLRALKYLVRHYVGLMEHGRNRILDLGGTCDPVDVMERSDPHLRIVREAIATYESNAHESSQPSKERALELAAMDPEWLGMGERREALQLLRQFARAENEPPDDVSPALDYADAIAERRAAQPPGSEWVDTDERVPEIGAKVIYYFDQVGMHIGKYYGTDDDGLHVFGGKQGFLGGDVSHWMPLPSPPTKEVR